MSSPLPALPPACSNPGSQSRQYFLGLEAIFKGSGNAAYPGEEDLSEGRAQHRGRAVRSVVSGVRFGWWRIEVTAAPGGGGEGECALCRHRALSLTAELCVELGVCEANWERRLVPGTTWLHRQPVHAASAIV
jgi:hypothetical protein